MFLVKNIFFFTYIYHPNDILHINFQGVITPIVFDEKVILAIGKTW